MAAMRPSYNVYFLHYATNLYKYLCICSICVFLLAGILFVLDRNSPVQDPNVMNANLVIAVETGPLIFMLLVHCRF